MTTVSKNDNPEIGRKITAAIVAGKKAVWFEELVRVKQLSLMKVWGQADGYKIDATDLGEYIKLLGRFEAISSLTGELHRAPQVILVAFLGDAMKAALDVPGRTGPVAFAFEVGVVYDTSTPTSYRYVVRDLAPAVADDPLVKLRHSLGIRTKAEAQLALPDVDGGEVETPAPAPAPAARKR
jgi:hypothetical protein